MTNWIFYGVPALSVLLALVVVFYIYNNQKSKSKLNGHIDPDSINFLYFITIAVALGFSATGMWLSFDFALFFGSGNLTWTVAVIIFFLTSEIATIAGATGISYGANLGRARIVFISLFLLAGGFFCNSVINQFSISQQVDDIETQRRVQSDEYQMGLAKREQAETAAQNSYVSDEQYEAAMLAKANLEQAKQRWLAESAYNSNKTNIGTNEFAIDNLSNNCTSKFYGRLCTKKNDFEHQIAEQQAIIFNYNGYLSKRQYADNLNSQPLAAAVTDSAMPGYQVLSEILGADIDDVRANANQVLGFWLQIGGLLAWALFGILKAEKAKLMSGFSSTSTQRSAASSSTVPNGAVPAYHTGGLVHSPNPENPEVLAWLLANEYVLTQEARQKLERDYPGLLDDYNFGGVKPAKRQANTDADFEQPVTRRKTHKRKRGQIPKPYPGMNKNGDEIIKSKATWLEVFRYLMVKKQICATHANSLLQTNAGYVTKYGAPIFEEIKNGKWGKEVLQAVVADANRHLS